MSLAVTPAEAPPSRLRLGLRAGLLVAVLALAAMPVLNQLPVDNPLHVSDFLVSITGKWICYGILALSLDLAWGYAGILSLGHGAFFALGGYAMGMHLMRLIGPRGVYGHPVLPDFMVFLGYRELPWYWLGFDNFAFMVLMALAVPGLLAFVLGHLAFRSRITGVYLSIITQAMTYALMLAFFRNDMGFGGNNGFTDFKELLGMPLNTGAARISLFYASLVALILSYLLCVRLTRSKYGRVLTAIRDAESRVTVFENLELALKAPRGPLACLRWVLSGEARSRIEQTMHETGLAERAQDLAGILSHGQRQWLEIGMLLMQDPDLLLVDEPVAGMTDEETEHTAALLVRIAGQRSVVVVEHDLEFVRALGRRVTVLHEGSVLSEGSIDHVQNDPRVVEVYLGR